MQDSLRCEYKDEPRRYFSPGDAKGNVVEIGENRACITHSDGKTMRIATSFPADFGCGSAKAMSEPYPSTFLGKEPETEDDQIAEKYYDDLCSMAEWERRIFDPDDNGLYQNVLNTWISDGHNYNGAGCAQSMQEGKIFEPVDITEFFNCNMTEVHEQAYIYPRPKGFSMGLFQNGRYSHNWNQRGRHVVYVDDTLFRNSGGIVHSPSGIPFATPAEHENLACVSIYDVFPTDITIPLNGKGQEIAVLFIASTYCMQSYVENARITVTYADGTTTYQKLVYPINMDDWLTSALTTEAEIFYFNDFNHATVQRIQIDPEKELADIRIEAVANEVIMGIMGVSVGK